MSGGRALGVEEELQIIDPASWRLVPGAPRLLSRLPKERFSAELQRSTVEINSRVAQSLSELRTEILGLRQILIDAADSCGLAIAAVGMVPDATAEDFELTVRGRFSRMHEDYRVLVDEHLICGLQVHVDVDDRDLAVRLTQRVSEALPILLALSASSPFWRGEDTGYASMRTMVWRRWPTSGSIGPLESAEQYDSLVSSLIDTGVISDAKMAYFDVRPSHHQPTIELRVCDSCPLVDDAVLIAGLFRAAIEKSAQQDQAGDPLPARSAPVQQAAMWRAARSGLSGTLLGLGERPVPERASVVVHNLLNSLRPQLEDTGDWDAVCELADATLARGSSSDRQRLILTERGLMSDVARLLVDETASRQANAPSIPRSTAQYPGHSRDEAVRALGTPIAPYRHVFEVLDSIGTDDVAVRAQTLHERSGEMGLTFGVGGSQRVFPMDIVPRVIPAHEWSGLATGLIQRARAIEAFLRDIYGRAEIVRDGVLSQDTLQRGRGWREEGTLIPPQAVRVAIAGFDLVRDPVAGWRVLEDNVRFPSGIGYAIAVRQAMRENFPELLSGVSLHEPEDVFSLLNKTLKACSDQSDPVVALLSSGADNSAWYEHRLLAQGADLLLVGPDDVDMSSGIPRVGGREVDVFYLRLECELPDLLDSSGRALGMALVIAASKGEIAVVNAPGNAIADDKAMYCYIPDFIRYYLSERPLLAPVPTYRCSDPDEYESVLDRLGELVTKPVDGFGGTGVLIGPDATEKELALRRAEIQADRWGWVGQETVALSTLPTLVGDQLEPRHVDLRTFVLLSGHNPGDAALANVALTRVAPAGTMIVNSSRGGGAKDTWILRSDMSDPSRAL